MWAQSQPSSYRITFNSAEAMPGLLLLAEIPFNRVKGPWELEAVVSGVAAAAVWAITHSVRTESSSSGLRGDVENHVQRVLFQEKKNVLGAFIYWQCSLTVVPSGKTVDFSQKAGEHLCKLSQGIYF